MTEISLIVTLNIHFNSTHEYLMIIYYILCFCLLRNKYFIPTKFHQNQSSGSGEEFENVKKFTDGQADGRTTDGAI